MRPLDALPWGWIVLVFALVTVAYWPSLSGAFLWNDSDYVTHPDLRTLSGLGRIWGEVGATQQYYPLLHSAFWLQHRGWGNDPVGYHIVTVLLHAGSAVLFGLVLRRLAIRGAWVGALFFALHPVHVQSVAWITEQKNTLSMVFYLGAALAYFRFDDSRRGSAYALALGLFVLSLLCKTVTVTLPAALLVVLWWKHGRLGWSRDGKPLGPWLVLGAVAGVFSSWVEKQHLGALGQDFDLSWMERILVAGRSFWFYLGKLVWPADLNFIYPRWTVDTADTVQWLFPVAALALVAAAFAVRRRSRAPLAVVLLFAGSLFPVLGFVNLYGALYSFVWDHWQYLPDLAPLALAASGVATVADSLNHRLRGSGWAAVSGLVALLAVLSWRHCGLFQDEESLYRRTLARNPDSWMAHNNLGNLLAEKTETMPEAITHLEAALRLKPDAVYAHNNLGNLLVRSGRVADALPHYREALRLDPTHTRAHKDLGTALMKLPDRVEEAVVHFEAAVQQHPDDEEAHNNLGTALLRMGQTEKAIQHFRAAIGINPDFAKAHNNLGAALVRVPGGFAEAKAHVLEALRVVPELAEAHYTLGLMLHSESRFSDAHAEFQKAVELNPHFDAARHWLRRTEQAKE